MTLSGEDLGAELVLLLHVAEVSIPNMAKIYQNANEHYAGCAEVNPFIQNDPGTGKVGEAWHNARQQIQEVMGETQGNLNDTSEALYQIINSYTESDEEAANQLRIAGEGESTALGENNDMATGDHKSVDGPDESFEELTPLKEGQDTFELPDTDEPNMG